MPLELKPENRFSRRHIAVIGIVVIVLAMVALWLWPEGETFKVNGVPFRAWVAQHPDFIMRDSLTSAGTNAIPHFIRILREPLESERAYAAKEWLHKHLPPIVQRLLHLEYYGPSWQLKRTCLLSLRDFGPEAQVALPDVLRLGRAETNMMVSAAALAAALQIAPESPDTFAFFKEVWDKKKIQRRDLAIYLQATRYPPPAAAPLLLEELKSGNTAIPLVEGFKFMGNAARPAVPYMREFFKEQQLYRGNILELYYKIGPAAEEVIPDMISLLRSTNIASIGSALKILKSIGPEARSALPDIEPLATNSDVMVRVLAAAASARIQGKPELAVSVLIDALKKPRSKDRQIFIPLTIRQTDTGNFPLDGPEAMTLLLGELGPSAHDALPALEANLATNKYYLTRILSAEAIWRISGDTGEALPVLVAIVTSPARLQQTGPDAPLIRAIEAVGDMGPAARDAAPALRSIDRYSMPVHRAVYEALKRIER